MRLYNSLTGKKEEFIPRENKKVSLYVCGITPYDTTHLGHAFTYVFFDVLTRYLRSKDFKVTYTQNVTDIDDDILREAKKRNKNWQELGNFWTKRFLNEMKALNVLPPTHYVKATGSVTSITQIIEVLIKKGFAYQKNDNVYFEVDKFKDYGKLSRLNKKQMIFLSRERGANPDDPLKKNPLDFLLWQKSKKDEPSWKSPWGAGPSASLRAGGRPGWHIECSAMIKKYLGDQIDIHGGGYDLIFPHHESEIAQTESFTGKTPFVKFWLHTAMLSFKGEKMSKSLGNLVMVSDLLKNYSLNTIRFLLLSHHYRKPWEFREKELLEADKKMTAITKALKIKSEPKKSIEKQKYAQEITDALDDNLNTPKALEIIQNLAKANIPGRQKVLKENLELLGFTF